MQKARTEEFKLPAFEMKQMQKDLNLSGELICISEH